MLIDQYEEAIRQHRAAMQHNDSEKANGIYAELMRIVKAMKNEKDGLAILRPLLNSEDIDVRCTAAAHLLGTFEQEAIGVLQVVAGGSGLTSFEAEMVLAEWRAGRMQAP